MDSITQPFGRGPGVFVRVNKALWIKCEVFSSLSRISREVSCEVVVVLSRYTLED